MLDDKEYPDEWLCLIDKDPDKARLRLRKLEAELRGSFSRFNDPKRLAEKALDLYILRVGTDGLPDNPAAYLSEIRSTMGMDLLLDWLSPDSDEALKNYYRLRRKLTTYFWNFIDPESLADDAIDRAVEKLNQGKATPQSKAETYIMSIARNMTREQFRELRMEIYDDTLYVTRGHQESAKPTEEQYTLLWECIERELDDSADLFLSYCLGKSEGSTKEFRNELAKSSGMTLNNLRVKVHRMKKKLARCIKGKLAD